MKKNFIRNKTFWTIDKIMGGKIHEYYSKLKSLENVDSDSDYLKQYQQNALNKLVEHAINTTEYYRSNVVNKNFEEFPLIDKNIIRSRQNEFISDFYRNKKLKKMRTSGSTGTPFISYQNTEKRKRVLAELIYYNEKLGYHVGKNIIFLRSFSNKNEILKKPIRLMQNQTLISVKELDDNTIEKLLSRIEKKANNYPLLMSYASTLDAFRDYFKKTKRKYNFNVAGIVSGAEMLYNETREEMEKNFNCKCISRYSNQENGVLGQDYIENNTFLINEAHYFIEVFKLNENSLAEPGEIGRIVVTDLYNFAMPMIRYDTGDIGAIKYIDVEGVKKKAIYNFGGRKIDMVYKADGTILSPHKISVTFWSIPNIRQFQFIQVGPKNYEVILNVEPNFNQESNVEKKLRELLGDSALIRFIYTDDIPTLSSGKRKYIMNKMEK